MKSWALVVMPIIFIGVLYPGIAEAKDYYIYVAPIPKQWESTYGNILYDATKWWKERVPGTEFYTVQQVRHADFVFQWGSQPVEIKAGETRLGYFTTNTDNDFGRPYILITLGYFEGGKWNLVDPDYALQITIHEFGHAMGYGHSTDPNDIMYPSIYNYKDWLMVKSGQMEANGFSVVPLFGENIVSSPYVSLSFTLQEKVNSEIEDLKSSIFSTEDTLYKTKVKNVEAQAELDKAWMELSLAKESLANAEWTQKEGEEFLANSNYESAYYKYDYTKKRIDQGWGNIIETNSKLHNALEMDNFYQSSEKNEQPTSLDQKEKFCFLFWCW